MSLDKLQKQILDDASRRAEEAQSAARKQASEIIQNAKDKAKEIESAKKKELAEEIARMEAEQTANAELQESGVLLDARNAVVESELPNVRSLAIRMIKEKGYGKLIAMAISEAEAIAPQEDLVLVVNKNDSVHVKNFKGKVTIGEVENGVEIHTKNGDVKIAATIDGLFERNRQEIEKALIEEAFSGRKRSSAPAPAKPKVKAKKKAKIVKKAPAKKSSVKKAKKSPVKKSGKRRSR
jgi:vacuolar-type H+-ATPase subunit E/Vma4